MVICNARNKFLLAKSTKNILRGVNFTNLKTLGNYITKSKPHRSIYNLPKLYDNLACIKIKN